MTVSGRPESASTQEPKTDRSPPPTMPLATHLQALDVELGATGDAFGVRAPVHGPERGVGNRRPVRCERRRQTQGSPISLIRASQSVVCEATVVTFILFYFILI